jgi:hypothetical protein
MLKELIKEYEERFMSGGIQQSLEELEQLVKEIGDKKFTKMAEIGIADGGTLWLFAHLFSDNYAQFTVVDMDIRPITKKVMKVLEEKLLITFDVYETKQVGFKFKTSLDFLHIDGDHSYDALKYDYSTHSENVLPGGVIIIHDTMLMDGPIRIRHEIENSAKDRVITLVGHDTLCDCYGRNRINPDNKSFGTTVVWR